MVLVAYADGTTIEDFPLIAFAINLEKVHSIAYALNRLTKASFRAVKFCC